MKKIVIGSFGAVVSLLLVSNIVSAGVVQNSNETSIWDNKLEIQEKPLNGFTKSKIGLLQKIKENINDLEIEFIIQSIMDYINKTGQITERDIDQIIRSPELSSGWEFFAFASVSGEAGYMAGAGGFPFHVAWLLSILAGRGVGFWVGPSLFVQWGTSHYTSSDYTDFQINSLGDSRHITSYHKGFALFSPFGIWITTVGGTFPNIGSVCSVHLRSPLVFIKML